MSQFVVAPSMQNIFKKVALNTQKNKYFLSHFWVQF